VSELTLALIKIGFVAMLWAFALSIGSTIRADLFGVRPRSTAPRAPATAAAPDKKKAKPPKPPKPAKGSPRSLVITEGVDRGRQVALADGLTIGRGDTNAVPLRDEYVSTKHARVLLHEGRWFVEDIGSTNGTYVSGARITGPTPITDSSTIRLGRTVLELRK